MCTRAWFFSVFVLVPTSLAAYAQSQPQQLTPPSAPMSIRPRSPPLVLHRPLTRRIRPVTAAPGASATPAPATPVAPAAPAVPAMPAAPAVAEPLPLTARPGSALAQETLAEIGFANGVRLANLGGREDLFIPLPQDSAVAATELVLAIDDISAHEARRTLEVQVNDRTMAAIALDGKSRDRIVRVPLGRMHPKDGYLKLSFLYSGAATLDHCIDVRYVGDSLTVRPETAVQIDIGAVGELDVATTAALMPRDVTIVLPGRRVNEGEIATAVTVARSLISRGRRVSFHHGFDGLNELSKRDEAGHWTRGIVVVSPLPEAAAIFDPPLTRLAGAVQSFGTLAAVRLNGLPALLVSDGDVVRAGLLFASPLRAATRGVAAASVGEAEPAKLPTDRVTFGQLGVPPGQIDVFGRADLTAVINMRRLPPETRATRLLLDVMVAPDGTGARAVVSAFVNDRLLGSTVASTTEATHLNLGLPDGLIGNTADIRVVIQRETAPDCRFDLQGYPAQILSSSALVLASVEGPPHDFSDLPPRFTRGVKLLLPAVDGDQPELVLGLLSQVVDQLSPDVAPLSVGFIPSGAAPAPNGPFIAVSEGPPAGANPRVHFDRGRVVVADRSGRTLLDLGGFVGGAVAQVVAASDYPGAWIKPFAANGAMPSPHELRLDRGDVAFIDSNGVALAMSTERDTVVQIDYPDQVSWLTVADRFRSWIIAGLWLFATAILLFFLQRVFRRWPAQTGD